jgi:hypothetical protein
MRPQSIELFEKVYLGSIALGLVNTALSWGALTATLQNAGNAAVAMGPGLMIMSIAISLVISVLLWFFIARRASNIAKWIYVVITAIGVFGVISSLANPLAPKGVTMIGGFVATGLQVFAAWLLFKPDSVAWLESKGENGPGDPSTFD